MGLAQDIVNHPAYIRQIQAAGGQAVQETHSASPGIEAGLFDYPEWKEGISYNTGDLFLYGGQPGFVRQAHVSQSTWLPFTAGTESLYGARPRQRPDGVYPYLYNMRAERSMRVESGKDGLVYVCIQEADPLLYDPADVPAIFEKEVLV